MQRAGSLKIAVVIVLSIMVYQRRRVEPDYREHWPLGC
jgi:hypothetical protein